MGLLHFFGQHFFDYISISGIKYDNLECDDDEVESIDPEAKVPWLVRTVRSRRTCTQIPLTCFPATLRLQVRVKVKKNSRLTMY